MSKEQDTTYAIDLLNLRDDLFGPGGVEEVAEHIASVALEARDGPLEERVNVRVLSLETFQTLLKEHPLRKTPEDRATRAIFDWAADTPSSLEIATKNPHPSAQELLQAMFSTREDPREVLIWISPPKKGKYEEARIAVYETATINNQESLIFRAICGNQSQEECLEIANKLSPTLIPDSEELRATPLAVTIPANVHWLNFLNEHIPMSEVWGAIATGNDIEEKKKALGAAKEIIVKQYQRIKKITPENHQDIGEEIEEELEELLGIELSNSACGDLYSSGDAGFDYWENFWDYAFTGGENAKFIRNCGACGVSLNKYMTKGDRCPCCNGVYEGC